MRAATPLPEGFRSMMAGLLGPDAELLCQALDGEPATGVRLNPRKLPAGASSPADAWRLIHPDGPEPDPSPYSPSSLILSARPFFTAMPELHAGGFYVQDPSSAVIESLVQAIARPDMTVLDLCAAPGGKSTAALSALPDGTVFVANEVMPQRASILRENMLKWGRPDTFVTSAEASAFGSLTHTFGLIIADVPCSGEGMMRKDEEARRQWSPRLVEQCAALQRSIVADVLPALRPGGYLIYSTCTFNRTENEDNVLTLINDFGLEPVDTGLAGVGGILPSFEPKLPALRFMPHATRGEGLFITLLRKPDAPLAYKALRRADIPRPVSAPCGSWLGGSPSLYSAGGSIHAMSPRAAEFLGAMQRVRGLRILEAGTPLASQKGKDFVPAPTAALADTLRADAFPRVSLSRTDAIRYLRREALVLPPDVPRGFIVPTYNSLPLGFMKNLGNRANNLFPKDWRIITPI